MLPSLGVTHAYVRAHDHESTHVRTTGRRSALRRVRARLARRHR